MCAEIHNRTRGELKKKTGERRDETVVHVVSNNKDESMNSMSRDEPEASSKLGDTRGYG